MGTPKQFIQSRIRAIDAQIEREWKKPCKNYSDAHFRAERITNLQSEKEELINQL